MICLNSPAINMVGFTYTDIFTRAKIFVLGLKSIDLRLNHYTSDGLSANIGSLGFKFY
jgi:hypothetical protein